MTSNLLSPHSGNGYAQNNELAQEPPAAKYRPDQHSSTGSGMAPGGALGRVGMEGAVFSVPGACPHTHPWASKATGQELATQSRL